MKMSKTGLLIAFLFLLTSITNGQALKIAAGNTMIGTANGAAIGLSVMGLTNNADLTPLRFGIGAGTLFGLGVAAYDVSNLDGLGYYYVEGLFNSTEYTSLIVLLDTAYGSVTGSVIGMAIGLMANENLLTSIQYGASAGAIGGFVFGLADAFYLSNSNTALSSSGYRQNQVDGLLTMQITTSSSKSVQLGLINPSIISTPSLVVSGNTPAHSTYNLTVDLLSARISF